MSRKRRERCCIKGCKEPTYINHIRVRVFHPNSGRKTWQSWWLCKQHFKQFTAEKGKGWYWEYYRSKIQCPVIGYELETL